jgi:hypothetical protein
MSTNDDSASRRGRRADQGGSDRRPPNRQNRDDRWDQSSSRDRDANDPYFDQQGRDAQGQRGSYSGFSRHAYPAQRQDQAPAPAPQQPISQGYYQEPVLRADPPRPYDPAVPPYAPQPQAYEPDPHNPAYHETGRDDLFGAQGAGYQADPYDQNPGRQPMMQPAAGRRDDAGYYPREAPSPLDDYERSFAARAAAQEGQASRFFLPEDQSQQQRPMQPDRGYAPAIPQAPLDRGYAPAQQYNSNGYDLNGAPQDGAGQDAYGMRYTGQETWAAGQNVNEGRSGLPQRAHGDELDEDFFADEDELDHDHYLAPKRGRKKLIAAALVGAIAVGGGGAYYYKTIKCCSPDNATPVIHADTRPSKDMPGSPGGKQFPNGEKAIYDRLTPSGQQVVSFAPNTSAPSSFAPVPAAGNSLEDRIEEALKKAQRSGDAPAPQGVRPAPDQPTVVKSESYRPDGTRVDAGRPVMTPSIVSLSGGQLPPPFGNAGVSPAEGPPASAPFRTTQVQSAPAQQFASMTPPQKSAPPAPETRPASFAPASEPARASATGFYVSLKSAPDEKAIQKELPGLVDKYKSVLGDVQLSSKVADLGAKGVKFRAVAGPLGTRQEAMELCQKIKGIGGDCFVAN